MHIDIECAACKSTLLFDMYCCVVSAFNLRYLPLDVAMFALYSNSVTTLFGIECAAGKSTLVFDIY
jgi:hypothetical protein